MNKLLKFIALLILIVIVAVIIFFYRITFLTYETGYDILLYTGIIMAVMILNYIRSAAGIKISKAESMLYKFLPLIIFFTGYVLTYTMINVYTGCLIMASGLVYYLYTLEAYGSKDDDPVAEFWRRIIFSFILLFVGFTLCLRHYFYFFGIPIAIFGYICYIKTRNSDEELGTKKLFRLFNKAIPVLLIVFTMIGVFGS